MARQSEMAVFFSARTYSTAIQRVNYPIHKGAPNPAHGKYFFVGSIPANCYDTTRNGGAGGSKFYDTQDDAIEQAIAGGATHIQRTDCTRVDIATFRKQA